jgi:hypothetical protein
MAPTMTLEQKMVSSILFQLCSDAGSALVQHMWQARVCTCACIRPEKERQLAVPAKNRLQKLSKAWDFVMP